MGFIHTFHVQNVHHQPILTLLEKKSLLALLPSRCWATMSSLTAKMTRLWQGCPNFPCYHISYFSAMLTWRTGRAVEPAPGGNFPNFSVGDTSFFLPISRDCSEVYICRGMTS